jgi:hypothetical protein
MVWWLAWKCACECIDSRTSIKLNLRPQENQIKIAKKNNFKVMQYMCQSVKSFGSQIRDQTARLFAKVWNIKRGDKARLFGGWLLD